MSAFYAHETLTISSTAVALTAATYAGARAALITVEDASVRYRFDGGTPTSSVGHVADAGDIITLETANELVAFKAIRKDGSDATISVSYGDTASVAQRNAAVAGTVASGTADSGNPVKVGGKYNATLPTLTDGQRGDMQLSPFGQVRTQSGVPGTGQDGFGNGSLFRFSNGSSAAGAGIPEAAAMHFNGVSWDRVRGNAASTGLASAARTASAQTADQTNYNGRGAQIILDVTATPNNAETLQVTVEVKDSVSNKYVRIAAFTALVASALGATPTTETYAYTLYPGAAETTAVANHEVQSLPLGRTWRVNVLHSAGGSWTYSVNITNLV